MAPALRCGQLRQHRPFILQALNSVLGAVGRVFAAVVVQAHGLVGIAVIRFHGRGLL